MFRLILVFVLATLTCGATIAKKPFNESQREYYLERAQVWHKTDIPGANILQGPVTEIAAMPDTEIACTYVEWKKDPTGASPKFDCKLANGKTVRVKYGETNLEIFAEPIATRLMWALGFSTDDVYPVHIRCLGCPEKNPFKPEKGESRVTRRIDYAMIERRYPGLIIESREDEGWSWKELEKIDPQKGGASPDQVGALVLLAVLMQHGDHKAQQQRIGCAAEDWTDKNHDGIGRCDRPVMMIQDLGSTFGRADQFTSQEAKVHFQLWADQDIWNLKEEAANLERTNHRACIGNLTGSAAAGKDGLYNPFIREDSRKFLADLLVQLSDKQIADLFRLGRVDELGEKIKIGDGVERAVTLQDWVDAFKKKRQQIVDRNCTVDN